MEFFWALKLQFFSLIRNVFNTVTILLFWELPPKLANFLLSQGERIPVCQNMVSSCVDSFFDFSHVAWKMEFVRERFWQFILCLLDASSAVTSVLSRHTIEIVVSEKQFQLMLTILYELFCRILSKTQQFLALMKTLRKILIFSLWNWSPSDWSFTCAYW